MEAAAPLPGGARRSRSSRLLLPGPGRTRSDAQLLEDALGRLSGATAAITANVRRINGALERILEDKATVEELNQMLMCQGRGPGLSVSVQHQPSLPEELRVKVATGSPQREPRPQPPSSKRRAGALYQRVGPKLLKDILACCQLETLPS